MNFPEYRATVRRAQMRFEEAVREASEVLEKDLMAADDQFFEEQDKAMAVDDNHVAMKRREAR